MDIPKTLKEVISNIPEVIDENTIELTITEKWEVLKSNLLSTKESIENHINNRQVKCIGKVNKFCHFLGTGYILRPAKPPAIVAHHRHRIAIQACQSRYHRASIIRCVFKY